MKKMLLSDFLKYELHVTLYQPEGPEYNHMVEKVWVPFDVHMLPPKHVEVIGGEEYVINPKKYFESDELFSYIRNYLLHVYDDWDDNYMPNIEAYKKYICEHPTHGIKFYTIGNGLYEIFVHDFGSGEYAPVDTLIHRCEWLVIDGFKDNTQWHFDKSVLLNYLHREDVLSLSNAIDITKFDKLLKLMMTWTDTGTFPINIEDIKTISLQVMEVHTSEIIKELCPEIVKSYTKYSISFGVMLKQYMELHDESCDVKL